MKQAREEIKMIKHYANMGLSEYEEASIFTLICEYGIQTNSLQRAKEITTQIRNHIAKNLQNNTLTIIVKNTDNKPINTVIFGNQQGEFLKKMKPYTGYKDIGMYKIIKNTLQEITIENNIKTNLLEILSSYNPNMDIDCSIFTHKLANIRHYAGETNMKERKKKYYPLPYSSDQIRAGDFLFMYQANEKEQTTRQHRAYTLDNNIFLSKLGYTGPIACNTFEELSAKYNYRMKIMWKKLP